MIHPLPQLVRVDTPGRRVQTLSLDFSAAPPDPILRARLDSLARALPLELVSTSGEWHIEFAPVPSLPTPEDVRVWENGRYRRDRYTIQTVEDQLTSRMLTRLHAESESGALFAFRAATESLARDGTCPSITVVDYPSIEHRGIVEGFYAGRGYRDEERDRLIRLAARLRMDRYLYGPKHDPWHRDRWFEQYPAAELTAIANHAATARRELVQFFWAIAPGKTYRPDASARACGFNALKEKLRQLSGVGIANFGLFLDDLFRYDAERDVTLMKRFCDFVKSEWPAARIAIVGDWYARFPVPYTDQMGAAIDEDVELLWTGPEVYAWSISAKDMSAINNSYQRAASIWDNAPMLLGPLRSRSRDLPDAVRAYYSNPVVCELDRHPVSDYEKVLGTVGDYAWNAEQYDPKASWERWTALLQDPE